MQARFRELDGGRLPLEDGDGVFAVGVGQVVVLAVGQGQEDLLKVVAFSIVHDGDADRGGGLAGRDGHGAGGRGVVHAGHGARGGVAPSCGRGAHRERHVGGLGDRTRGLDRDRRRPSLHDAGPARGELHDGRQQGFVVLEGDGVLTLAAEVIAVVVCQIEDDLLAGFTDHVQGDGDADGRGAIADAERHRGGGRGVVRAAYRRAGYLEPHASRFREVVRRLDTHRGGGALQGGGGRLGELNIR